MKKNQFLSAVKKVEKDGRILIPKLLRDQLKLTDEDRIMINAILDTDTNETILEIRKEIRKEIKKCKLQKL